MAIEIYDQGTIDQLKWPDTEEGQLAKLHLFPLMKEGAETYIQNAKTSLFVLKIDQLLIPISVNETEYQNSYLLSSYFVAANLKEKMENKRGWSAALVKPWISLFGTFLKVVKINKVVIINNWLLSTNPYPELTASQIGTITDFLQKRFPDHYFMFRSVNTYKSSDVYEALKEENFRMIPCRHVYLYDPKLTSTLPHSILRKQKKDTNRLHNKQYSVETLTTLTPEEINRLLELYRNIYVSKYTRYSPLYTAQFLLNVLKNPTFRLKVLKKDGVIYGVSGFMEKNGYLLVPFFGYDTSIPQEEGLYRMLSAVILQEIETRQLISHQGSGAGQFKKWRGFFEQIEYVGIYDKHLPLSRRLFWLLSQKFSPRFIHTSSDSLEEKEA